MNFDWYSIDAVDYIPLGIIGFARWGIWAIRKAIGFSYAADRPRGFAAPVSIITPVYKEDPEAFEAALDSWIANRPNEIIAVVDIEDQACADVFRRKRDETRSIEMQLLMTAVPGKRPALAMGIRAASSEITALVDSDTLWEEDSLPKLIAPFANKDVGGVTCRQAIYDPQTLAQKLASLVFEMRYADELPFLGRMRQGFSCLSGRTAVYRRDVVLPVLDEMVSERFLGRRCISGEDKRLTYLVQSRGWATRYQDNVTVTTFSPPRLATFLKQKVRWTRNSWRADLRALFQRWTWRRPALALYLVDKCVSAFTTLVSPLFFAVIIYLGEYTLAIAIVAWWLVSRFLKALPYLHRHPRDVWIVPVFVVFGFMLGVMRVFSLVTMNRQGWLTREHNTATRRWSWRPVTTAGAYFATGSTLALVLFAVINYRQFASP